MRLTALTALPLFVSVHGPWSSSSLLSPSYSSSLPSSPPTTTIRRTVVVVDALVSIRAPRRRQLQPAASTTGSPPPMMFGQQHQLMLRRAQHIGRHHATLFPLMISSRPLPSSSSSSSSSSLSSSRAGDDTKNEGRQQQQPSLVSSPSSSSPKSPEPFSSRRVLVASRLFFLLATFGAGYLVGLVKAAVSSRSVVVGGRRQLLWTMVSAFAVTAVVVRDMWRWVPSWARKGLFRRAVSDTSLLLGLEKEQRSSSRRTSSFSPGGGEVDGNTGADDGDDEDDISNFDVLFGKMGAVARVFQAKLSDDEDSAALASAAASAAASEAPETSTTAAAVVPFNLNGSLLALLRLRARSKEAGLPYRDDLYASCGDPATQDDIEPLLDLMDLADWAYDEVEGSTLEELLEGRGYSLLRHDQTALPGRLGHYVAIPRDPTAERVAIVGIKGTSGIEDLLTDMCGAAVSFDLDRPYIRGGSRTTLVAHDGILIGARRLANDLQPMVETLLLPAGYRLVLVGHSLGAAAGALLAIFLRVQIPTLQKHDDPFAVKPSNRLMQVYAFASPPILDLENALAVRPFVTAVVNDADIVARCNVGTVASTVGILRAINAKQYSDEQAERQKGGKQGWKLPFGWNKSQKATPGDEPQNEDADDLLLRTNATTAPTTTSETLPFESKGVDMIEEREDVTSNKNNNNNNAGVTESSKSVNKLSFLKREASDGSVSDGKLLADAQELDAAIKIATASLPLNDTDYLYVPGRVILMYDEWGSKKGREDPPVETGAYSSSENVGGEESSGASLPQDTRGTLDECPDYSADKAVVCDGTATALRYIEFDTRMVFDHNTLDYMQSLRSVLRKMDEQ